ncbi:glycosyltransferase family 2 protein [Acinetobacter gerneri]|uniref:glycosyltransferase family 2 protein n=1 Tax=Acinetobacter gerneri TaxID=202952 RepID=UPI003AF699C0
MIKVSYLIPLYNKENFILECIDSILNEASDEIEIEICIVDDGSFDKSLELVKKNYRECSNVKIGSFEFNRGKNAACNEAFKMSTGDYLCLFGADDVVIKGRTRLLLQKSSNTGKAVYGGLIAKNEKLSEEFYRALPISQDLYSITMGNGLSGGCCLIPRELSNNIFPIPENLKFEDWWISYNLVKDEKVLVLDAVVTVYRIGSQNDCGYYGGDAYANIKKDYVRHFDCLNKFKEISANPFIEKSFDLRKSFLGEETTNTLYLKPFDKFSLKILLFKFLGAKSIYKLINFIQRFKN